MSKKSLFVFRIFQLFYTGFLLFLIIKDICCSTYDKVAFADLFINYQGGFVRRGLLGDLLLRCYHGGLNPITIALVLSFISFTIVAVFIIKQFLKHKYELGLLPVCFLLGGFGVYGFGGFRRDFMMLCIFLLIVYIWRRYNNKYFIYVGANIIACIAILMYEPFIFWGVPLLFLLSLRDFKIYRAMLIWVPVLLVFFICCKYSGNIKICHEICNSVSGFCDNPGIIAFLQRSTNDVIKFHLGTNFGFYHHVPTILISLVSLTSMVYYFVNGIYAFTRNEETKSQRQFLFLIIIFVLICQIPMFTMLSIDYSRTCIVSTLSSLIFYFSVKPEELNVIFNSKSKYFATKIISFIDKRLPPTTFKIIFVCMCIGVTSCTLSNEGCFGTSELGEIARVMLRMLR